MGARQVEVIHAEARRWLAGKAEPFDIIFLDHPFTGDMLESSCMALAQTGWLGGGVRIYLEAPAKRGFPPLPEGWYLARCKQAGQVLYGLAEIG